MNDLKKENKQILYIDDEQENLDTFRYVFHQDYNIFTVTNAADGYEILKNQDIKIVISDQRMPDISGTDLLEDISIKYPDIIRIILTAYVDAAVVMEAINKGQVYRFLSKPWDLKEVKNTLENAFETWTLRNENARLIENLHHTNKELTQSNKKLQEEVEARKNAQDELTKYKNQLETIVKERTHEIKQINQELHISNEELSTTNDELNRTNEKLKQEIEERYRIQANLELSEEKFRRFMEQSTDAISLIDEKGTIIEWNKGSEHIFGAKRKAITGKHVAEVDLSFQPPEKQNEETRNLIYNSVEKFLNDKNKKKQLIFETEIVDNEGLKKLLAISVFHIETSSGGFIGRIAKDITVRKKLEEELKTYQNYLESLVEKKSSELKENEARLSLVLNSVPLAFYILPTFEAASKPWISDQVETFTGFTKKEFEADIKLWLKQIHPEDKERVLKTFDNLVKTKFIKEEYRWRDKNGDYRWFLDQAILTKDKSNKKEQIIGVWIDITERKNNEKELEEYRSRLESLVHERTEEVELVNEELKSTNEELYEKNQELFDINDKLQKEIAQRIQIQQDLEMSENMVRSFIEQSADGISLLSAEGKILEWNLALENITGMKKEQVLNKNSWEIEFELMTPENKSIEKKKRLEQKVKHYLTQLHDKQNSYALEGYILNKKEEKRFIQVNIFPIKTKDRLYIGRIFRDMTERQQKDTELERYRSRLEQLVEERTFQLKQSEEKFSKVFKYSPSFVVLSTLEQGEFIDVNDVFIKAFGYKKEELIGKTAYELGMIDQKTRNKNASYLIENGYYDNLEVELKTKKGKTLNCISSGEVVEIENENYIVQVITDITDRKKAEDELKSKNEELMMAEEELRSVNEELISLNEELQDRNKQLEQANANIANNEEKYRALFEQAVDGILVGNQEGEIIEVNTFMSRMTGYPKHELLDKKIDVLFNPEILQQKPLRFDLLNAGITVHRLREIKTKDGRIIPVEMNTKRLPDGRMQSFIRDISDRVKAEKAIRESEEKYRTLIEGQTEMVVKVNVKGEFIFVSPSYCKTFGKTEKQLLGKTFLPLVHEQDRQPTEKAMKKLLTPPYKVYIEQRAYTKDGWRWIGWSDSAILNDNNEVVEIIGVGRDITKRKKYEEDLLRTNNLLAAINNATPDVIFILNLVERRLEYYNNRFKELFQYTDEEIVQIDDIISTLVADPDVDIPARHYSRLMNASDNSIIATEGRMQRKDGKTVWTLVREQVFERDLEGKPVKSVGVITNISERKQSENALIESENKFRLLFENANDAIFIMKEANFISCNKKTLEVFRCKSEDILGKTPYDFSPEKQPNGISSKQEARKRITSALRGTINTFEWKHKRADGTLFDAEVSLNSLNLNGEIFLQAIVRDVSDRKRAEKMLANSEKKFKNIFNNSSDAIAISDFDLHIFEVNDVFMKITGEQTKDKLLKQKVIDFVAEHNQPEVNDKLSVLAKTKKVQSMEVVFQSKNEVSTPVEINCKIIDYEGYKSILSVIRDITERKNTEKKVLDAIILTEEKEREKFAKNLHDDLGPLLSSIRMYLNSFMETQKPEKQQYIINQINDILKESIQTTKQISNDLSPHILANYGLISAVETFIDRLTHHLQIHFEHNLRDYRFNSSIEITYYRVIKELINNTIKHAKAQNIYIRLNVGDNQMNLSYKDDGIGFDKAIINQVDKRGMGLFNLISRIKSLNGKFAFDEDNGGTHIKIEIPLHQ